MSKKTHPELEEEDDDRSGGTTGEIEFHYKDAAQLDNRDDLLTPAEKKRILAVLPEAHKDLVHKQRQTREERKALKEGKKSAELNQKRGLGSGAGYQSRFKEHPISQKAQFSGIDRQVIALPNQNEAETNPEMKDRLENRLENRLTNRLQNTKTFNPKPRFPG